MATIVTSGQKATICVNVGGIEEAPIDGTPYARQDAGWVAAAGAGGSPLTTKGDLFTYSTLDARLPIGADGQSLVADSVESTGLKWDDSFLKNAGTTTYVGDVTISNLNGDVFSIAYNFASVLSIFSVADSIDSEVSSGSTTGKISISSNSAQILSSNFGSFSRVLVSTVEMLVEDSNNSVGLQYAADYSANFIPRSLVDKAYADNIVAVGTTAQRPSTPVAPSLRFNTDLGKMEFYTGSAWETITSV